MQRLAEPDQLEKEIQAMTNKKVEFDFQFIHKKIVGGILKKRNTSKTQVHFEKGVW